MELRQLRSLLALSETGFNVTAAAQRLHLVQSAVSQHLTRLEDELGTQLFVRQGKRLTGLTEAGNKVLFYARKTLADCENITAIAREHVEEKTGTLRIGTTHTQACYVLPAVVREFRRAYPDVKLQIHQGTPEQLVYMTMHDLVDFAICTEALGDHPGLTAVSCYRWNRSVIAPLGHPVLNLKPLSLRKLCDFPLITYVFGFTGSGQFRNAFARLGLKPDIVLSAADTDVIKTYVREGMGVGIIATLAHIKEQDGDLGLRDLSGIFPWETTRVAYKSDKYLRRYQEVFIELLQTMIADNGKLIKKIKTP
jgi:LysR family cys regulon transcriptional activator